MNASHPTATLRAECGKPPAVVALALAVSLALAGCTIGPDYERPRDLPAPEEFRGVLEPQDAASFADLAWADVFNDPELRPLIETALRNNLDVRLAAARVEEFRARVRASRSYYGPEIRATGNTSPSPGTSDDSSYTLGLVLNWSSTCSGDCVARTRRRGQNCWQPRTRNAASSRRSSPRSPRPGSSCARSTKSWSSSNARSRVSRRRSTSCVR